VEERATHHNAHLLLPPQQQQQQQQLQLIARRAPHFITGPTYIVPSDRLPRQSTTAVSAPPPSRSLPQMPSRTLNNNNNK